MRVFVAGLEHETNTFAPPTTRADFRARRELEGEAVRELAGTETAVGGVLDALEERGFDVVPSVAAAATPGGPVDRDVYEAYCERVLADLRAAAPVDGVALALHGAMVPAGGVDGEGPLLAAVRDVVGDTLVVATLDLHGNVSEAMVDGADALLAFRTFPHLDKAATGERAVGVLSAAMAGEADPVTRMARPPMVAFVPEQHTEAEPMAGVQRAARRAERRADVLDVSVLPGFYHADVPEMGFSVLAVADGDGPAAEEAATAVAGEAWERRTAFVADYPDAAAAVGEVRAALDAGRGPVVVGDFGPNPGAGGTADGTVLLGELLDRGVGNAGYALLCDPAAVAAAVEAGVGERVSLALGGAADDRHGDPLDVEASVKAITDGRYVNTGSSHEGRGVENDVGRLVRLRVGDDDGDGVSVLVSEQRHSAFDAEVWRHAGVQPERLDVLCVPSFLAFLGDYGRLAETVVLADTPGLSAVDPARFEYERIPRPLFPLDEVADDAFP